MTPRPFRTWVVPFQAVLEKIIACSTLALPTQSTTGSSASLQLLLWPQHVCVPALLLAAIYSTCMQPSVTLPANHFVTVVFPCQNRQRGLDDATAQTKYQVQGGFFLDVVIAQSPTVFKLFACKDETLLVRSDAFFILYFGFHVVNRVRCLHVECDSLPSQGFHENLHGEVTRASCAPQADLTNP